MCLKRWKSTVRPRSRQASFQKKSHYNTWRLHSPLLVATSSLVESTKTPIPGVTQAMKYTPLERFPGPRHPRGRNLEN